MQNIAATLLYSWDESTQDCTRLSFHSKCIADHYTQTVSFKLSHKRTGPKDKHLLPYVNLWTSIFFWHLWTNGLFLSEWPFSLKNSFHCGYWHCITSFSQYLHKIFCFSSGVEMHILHQNIFKTENRSLFLSDTQTGPRPNLWSGCLVRTRFCLSVISNAQKVQINGSN